MIRPLLPAEDSPRPVDFRRRTWLLMLLDGAERAALTPLPGRRLHHLSFLANCLSPVYAAWIPAGQGKVVKYRRGPFYAELQWDLDRMAVQGLALMKSIRHERDDFGWWFFADYGISERGLEAVRHATGSPWAERTQRFLWEVAAAYASLDRAGRSEAAFQDANFSDPTVPDHTVIDFAEWQQRNYSARLAEAFSRYTPNNLPLTQRDRLHLYFRYLDRMVARGA
jgi:hypothetical protein